MNIFMVSFEKFNEKKNMNVSKKMSCLFSVYTAVKIKKKVTTKSHLMDNATDLHQSANNNNIACRNPLNLVLLCRRGHFKRRDEDLVA